MTRPSYRPLILTFLLIIVNEVFTANILMTVDLSCPSHEIWNYALAEGLIEKGHNVTMLGPHSNRRNNTERYHPITFEGVADMIAEHSEFSIEYHLSNTDPLTTMKVFFDYTYEVCKFTYKSNGFKAIMDYPSDFKFDLIIVDVTIGSCLYPFIQRFNYPPTIGVTAFLLPPFLSDVFGNDLQPSYLPFYHTRYTQDMTFYQRVTNYLLTFLDSFSKQNYEHYELGKLAKKAFGDNVDSMVALERHISLLLCNVNAAVYYPQPVTPNIIPVGGLHVKPAKTLPKDLQRIMDKAKHGVILFTLGTNSRSDSLNLQTQKALLKAFGKLKQEVVWKFESDLDDVPKNVHVRKWLPQNDILGHPNTKLFISHGGALSTMETSYHGVPVIGLPFYIDQRLLVNLMVERKLALKWDVNNITYEYVLDTINEVLQNPMYARNMKEVSRRMRDQQNTPLDTAVFWAEFAMRHNGTHFLTPKSRDMSLFVSSSTDVKLFLISVILSVIYCLYKLCQTIKGVLRAGDKRKEKVN